MSERFRQASDDYHGVVGRSGEWRLAIAPNGTRWLVQRVGVEAWAVKGHAKALAKLRERWPEVVAACAPDGLCDDPRDYVRPWRRAMSEHRQRCREAHPCSDDFGGLVAEFRQGREGRLVRDRVMVVLDGFYQWRRCVGEGFAVVVSTRTRTRFAEGVDRHTQPGARVPIDEEHGRRLTKALAGFPDDARDADELPCETYDDIVAS